MSYMGRLVLILTTAALLLSGTLTDLADAYNFSNPLALTRYVVYRRNWVEQWNDWPASTDSAKWVVNQTSCVWGPNDRDNVTGTGYLAPQSSATAGGCVVGDPNPIYTTLNGTTAWWSHGRHEIDVYLVSKSPDLVIKVCFSPQNACFSPAPRPIDKWTWTYQGCVWGPNYASGAQLDSTGQPIYPPPATRIAGSNGGYGVLTTYTVTITNPTIRRVREITASVGFHDFDILGDQRTCDMAAVQSTGSIDGGQFKWSMPIK